MSESWLTGLPATGVTAVTLVVLLFVGLQRGLLYTGKQVSDMRTDFENRIAEHRDRVQEIREDRDARLAEKTEEMLRWRDAYAAAENGREVAAAQSEKLLQGLETTMAVVQAIPMPGGTDE